MSTSDAGVWRELTTVTDEAEARLIEGRLESEGIECQLESLRFTQEPVQFGLLGGIRVHVPASEHARAAVLLERLQGAQADGVDEADESPVGDDDERNGGR